MSMSPLGGTIRGDVANADFSVPFNSQLMSDGSQTSVNGTQAANTNLVIDTVMGAGAASDLFLGAGFSYIQNMNDTSPIIATGTDAITTELVYEGGSAGQTFFAGTGNEFAAFTGYGNIFAAPTVSGGTYEVSAGLVSGTDLVDLAPPPSVGSAQMGNTVVAGGGNASISAGLGNNAIFLGSGTALIANEGQDTILAGSGAATINGSGIALVYAGTGALTYFGGGGTVEILGKSDSTSGAMNVYGGTGSATVFGSGGGNLAAFGGLTGNNVLESSAGNATLVGGGNNDLLVAGGAGTNTLVAGAGNETLFGGGTTGNANFFLGSGADTVVAGSGTDYVQFGAGAGTAFAGSGSDVFGLVSGQLGATDQVVGFNSSADYLSLQGFGSSTTGSSVVASDTVMGGNTMFTIGASNTEVVLFGVTNLTAANFI